MTINVCVAGATGWAGRPIAEAIIAADDLVLRSAVSRSRAGQDLGVAWGGSENGVPVYSAVTEALGDVDVLVDYTSHDAVRAHVLAALDRRVAVVVGTSGLASDDFVDIQRAAEESGVGVIASGNFSLTAAMAQAAASLVARHLPAREIIDYASAGKPDAPSGTARELAERLADVRPNPGRATDRRDRRTCRGARGHHRRDPGPLRPDPELRGLDGGGVRPA
jgi:4-hydroxy-tetrahydrodipicolinate reductase